MGEEIDIKLIKMVNLLVQLRERVTSVWGE
jgi:hypothetical protein